MEEFSESVGQVGRDARHDQPGLGADDLQRLWAPWRFGYVAGAETLQGCPFCVLPGRDPARDRESLILHRGAHCFVIFNAYPYNPGHLMVCPTATSRTSRNSPKMPPTNCGCSRGGLSACSSRRSMRRGSTSA